MATEKLPSRREWQNVTLDALGFRPDGIPKRYLEPALERAALVLCNLPRMKLEDFLRELVRGSNDVSLDVAEAALAVHMQAGRINVSATMVTLRTTNSDGDEDEMEDEQRWVFPTTELGTWWNRENEGAKPGKEHGIVRDQSTEDRDRWIYEECCKGIHYTGIRGELFRLAPLNHWDAIESIPGIKAAAGRYAKRHSLPLPPPRKQANEKK